MMRHVPLPGRVERVRDEATRVLPAVVRVIAGMLWLANVDWKRPPDFRTLLRWVNEGVENPVLAPWSWALEHVVAPNIELFGWFTVAVEFSLAVLLISGTLTRLAALAGVAQTAAIGLTVLNAPHEWSWSYYLMATVHLAVFAMDAGKVWAVDALLRRARADDRPGVERGIRAGRVTVAAALAIVGVLIFATQVGDPFFNSDYGGSTFPLIRGTMALGVLFLAFGLAVWATAGKPAAKVTAAVMVTFAVLTIAAYGSDVNILSSVPSSAGMASVAAIFLLTTSWACRRLDAVGQGPMTVGATPW